MKYYLIVGEASGDLHASHLMGALKEEDPEADFRFFGGDLMAAVGGTMVKHYKELAYMGFIPVLLHLRTIFSNMKCCKDDIVAWSPDVVILVDYPGFNLNIAKFLHAQTSIPVYYYISPKIWAWKEYRIKNIKRDVDQLFSILPFEVEFFEKKHQYPIHYVGNPTVDEVSAFRQAHPETWEEFLDSNQMKDVPIIALLAGSRKQEVRDNLPRMIEAAAPFHPAYQLVVAGAPSIPAAYYEECMKGADVKVLFDQTYRLLQQANVALVTSGTATLEAALFRVPQVVCYYTKFASLFGILKKLIIKVPFVSLVNLIANREVVKELVIEKMTLKNMQMELKRILEGSHRNEMLKGYEEMAQRLGSTGAPSRAAQQMVKMLKK